MRDLFFFALFSAENAMSAVADISLTPMWMDESDVAHAEYGVSTATAGDVNGDGYADIIVGAPVRQSAGG